MRFVFFPFVSEGNSGPCIDAIVSPAISVFNIAAMVDHGWFSFINGLFGGDLQFLKASGGGQSTRKESVCK